MAKSNQAKKTADEKRAGGDPMSELSDIMKFANSKDEDSAAAEGLAIDLENELLGELSDDYTKTGPSSSGPSSAVSDTELDSEFDRAISDTFSDEPYREHPEESADDESFPTEAIEEIASPGDRTTGRSAMRTDDIADGDTTRDLVRELDEKASAEASRRTSSSEMINRIDEDIGSAAAKVPQELENQLNELLSGLDGRGRTPDESDLPGRDDVSDASILSSMEDSTEDDSASEDGKDEEEEPFAALAAIMAGKGKASISASKPIDATNKEDVPEVDTSEIFEEAMPLSDDLDIPEVGYESEPPPSPNFDDLDTEFANAFNRLTEFDKLDYEASTSVQDETRRLDETIEDIFADMAKTAAATSAVSRDPASDRSYGVSGAGDPANIDTDGDYLDRDTTFASSEPQWETTERARYAPSQPEDDFDDLTAPIDADDADYVEPPAAQVMGKSNSSKGGSARRGLLIAGIVVMIAAAGGIGAFTLSSGDGEDTAGPVLIKAEDDPIKVRPEEPGGKMVPNEDKAVYERVAGTGEEQTPTQEKLISTTEEPIDVAAREESGATMSEEDMQLFGESDNSDMANADESTEFAVAPKGEDRVLPEEDVDEGLAAETEEMIAVAPRRVKTLIVKPDGTLVPREDEVEETASSVAGELRTTGAEETVTAASETADDSAETTKDLASLTAPADTRAAKVEDMTVFDPVEGEAAALAKRTAAAGIRDVDVPIPTPAPRDLIAAAATRAAADETATVRQPEPPANVAAATRETATTASSPEWWVQISSQPSREAAQASYADMASRYGSIIGGRGVNIYRAEIEGKGTFYRVRIAGGTRGEAAALCTRLKDAGGNCFIAR